MTRSVKHHWLDHAGHWHEGIDVGAWVMLVLLGLLQLPFMLLLWLLLSPYMLWMFLRRRNKGVTVAQVVLPLFVLWVRGIGGDK